MTTPAVRCDDLAVGYGRHAVVTGVDLVLLPGQWLAVVGTNGSGKSTFLRTVAGLLPPVRGGVSVFGGDPGLRGASIAYLAQSHSAGFLLPLRSRDVVRMGRWPLRGLVGRLGPDDDAAVDAAMDALDISDLAEQPLGALSGGQCQRVHLAQALARAADLLLLDEPTSGLDAVSRERYLSVMDSERARGACVVSATHDVREAARADLVLLVAERVIACGPPGDVLTPRALADAFGVVLSGDPGGLAVLDPHHEHDHDHGPGHSHPH